VLEMVVKISENFNLDAFFVSAEYPEIARNMPVYLWQLANLWTLVNTVIQPVRNLLVEPVTVLSGIRTEGLNKLIGGEKLSDHLLGAACDITSKKIQVNPLLIAHLIHDSGIKYRQIIAYPAKGFIHISINVLQQAENKHQFLVYKHGKYETITT